ncbi:MAG: hypothetical protein ABI743_13620, partial [bacterium]
MSRPWMTRSARGIPSVLLILVAVGLLLPGCSRGNDGGVVPEGSANGASESQGSVLMAHSTSRYIRNVRFDNASLLVTGYVVNGGLPGTNHHFEVRPANGATLQAHWTVENGASGDSGLLTADGLTLDWTAPA